MTNKPNYKITVLISNLLLVLFTALIGGIIGVILGRASRIDSVKEIVIQCGTLFVNNAVYISFAINIVMCIICFSLYFKNKSLAAKWDGEDEETIDKIETGLSLALAIGTVSIILTYMLAAVGISGAMERGHDRKVVAFYLLAFLFIIWPLILQGRVFALRQKLNHESGISVFDLRFNKKYFESRDEGQKMVIYKAAYDVYKSLLYINLIMFTLAVFGMSLFHTGILPIVIICVSWLIETIIFYRAEYKYRNM